MPKLVARSKRDKADRVIGNVWIAGSILATNTADAGIMFIIGCLSFILHYFVPPDDA